MEFLQEFMHKYDAVLVQIAIYVTISRVFLKPFFSFWNKYMAKYIQIRPTEAALKHPLYKTVTYLLDWWLSVKTPQEKK